VRAELLRADGRTNRHELLTIAFPHFANAPTKVQCRKRPCFLFTCSPDSHRMMQDTVRFRQHKIGIVMFRRDLAAGSPPIISAVPKSSSQTGLFGLLRCCYPYVSEILNLYVLPPLALFQRCHFPRKQNCTLNGAIIAPKSQVSY
jgi:hypothetical protein